MPRRWVVAVAVWAAMGAGVLLFFLAVYPIRGYDQPRGYDTPRYLWRTNCVEAGGLDALPTCAPSSQEALPGRPAYPVLSLVLTGLLPVSKVALAAILPAAAAAAIALTAGALASSSLELGSARLSAVAAVVAVSPVVVSLATPEGYADAMLALAVGSGAVLATTVAVGRDRGWPAASVLLATAVLIHWPTGAVMAAIPAGLLVLVLIRPAMLGRGNLHPDRRAVAVRLATMLALSLLLWGLFVGVVGSGPDRFRVSRAVFEQKLRSHVWRSGLPIGLPVAALGMLALVRGRAGRRTLLVAVLSLWLAVLAVGVVAWFIGWDLPVHRFLLLGIPVPLLGAVALLWAADRLGGSSRPPAAWLVVAGCAAVVVGGFALWLRSPAPVMKTYRLDGAAAAGAYLESAVPPGRQVLVLADDLSAELDVLKQTFRTAVPADRIAWIRFRRRPLPDAIGREEVVLAVRGFSAGFDQMVQARPDRAAGPGVLVLSGPPPDTTSPPVGVPRLPTNASQLFLLGAAVLAVLELAGLGWAILALGSALRPLEVLSVAPTFGVATLVVAGLLADVLGLGVGSLWAVLAVAVAAMGGGALGLRRVTFS